MEREVERLGAELASTRQVSFLIIMVIIGMVMIIVIIIIMLQTILRMHEREEKMKERLMDLRLKSEEQVCVFLSCNCFMIPVIPVIKRFVSFFSPQISITSSSTSAVYLSVKGRSGPPGSPRGGSQGSGWAMI